MAILGVKKDESKKNYYSVFSFVLLKYCTKRLKCAKIGCILRLNVRFVHKIGLLSSSYKRNTPPPHF